MVSERGVVQLDKRCDSGGVAGSPTKGGWGLFGKASKGMGTYGCISASSQLYVCALAVAFFTRSMPKLMRSTSSLAILNNYNYEHKLAPSHAPSVQLRCAKSNLLIFIGNIPGTSC